MVKIIRFAFAKDIRYVVRLGAISTFRVFKEIFQRGGVAKPYNSVLGEHFRCHWTCPDLGQDGLPVPDHPDSGSVSHVGC